jgi:hypothetical protein
VIARAYEKLHATAVASALSAIALAELTARVLCGLKLSLDTCALSLGTCARTCVVWFKSMPTGCVGAVLLRCMPFRACVRDLAVFVNIGCTLGRTPASHDYHHDHASRSGQPGGSSRIFLSQVMTEYGLKTGGGATLGATPTRCSGRHDHRLRLTSLNSSACKDTHVCLHGLRSAGRARVKARGACIQSQVRMHSAEVCTRRLPVPHPRREMHNQASHACPTAARQV